MYSDFAHNLTGLQLWGPVFRDRGYARAATGARFLDRVEDSDLPALYFGGQAYLFPPLYEGFGLPALESIAGGAPVIAYRKGGALETVLDGKIGLFFDEQTADSLAAAVRRFEDYRVRWNTEDLCLNAERFSCERFQRQVRQYVDQHWTEFKNNRVKPL